MKIFTQRGNFQRNIFTEWWFLWKYFHSSIPIMGDDWFFTLANIWLGNLFPIQVWPSGHKWPSEPECGIMEEFWRYFRTRYVVPGMRSNLVVCHTCTVHTSYQYEICPNCPTWSPLYVLLAYPIFPTCIPHINMRSYLARVPPIPHICNFCGRWLIWGMSYLVWLRWQWSLGL